MRAAIESVRQKNNTVTLKGFDKRCKNGPAKVLGSTKIEFALPCAFVLFLLVATPSDDTVAIPQAATSLA